MRHPDEIVRSQSRMGFAKNVRHNKTRHLEIICDRIAAKAVFLKRTLPVGRLHILRYEDLIQDPVRAWASVHNFLGVPFTHDTVKTVESVLRQQHNGPVVTDTTLGNHKQPRHHQLSSGPSALSVTACASILVKYGYIK